MRKRQGGNGVIKFRGDRARKELKPSKDRARKARFAREINVVQSLSSQDFPAIVPILDADLDADPPCYEMPKYDGDLSNIVANYRGNVEMAAKALLPIVKDLEKLAQRSIFHRDIKPANILYLRRGGEISLSITDFGIAFVGSEPRMTDELRSVGPQAFRAPEYQHGRVDDVTDAGDVFSIGKLLWHMVNGVPHEVFPYTLWHPEEYDLARRFPKVKGISQLNLLIAGCVESDPAKRPSLSAVVRQLTSIVEHGSPSDNNPEKALVLKAFEARQQIRETESREIAENILRVFWEEWNATKAHVGRRYPESTSLSGLFERDLVLDQVVNRVVEKQVNLPIWHVRNSILKVSTRMHPPDVSRTLHPWIGIEIVTTGGLRRRSWRLHLYQGETGLSQEVWPSGEARAEAVEYENGVLVSIFESAISYLMEH